MDIGMNSLTHLLRLCQGSKTWRTWVNRQHAIVSPTVKNGKYTVLAFAIDMDIGVYNIASRDIIQHRQRENNNYNIHINDDDDYDVNCDSAITIATAMADIGERNRRQHHSSGTARWQLNGPVSREPTSGRRHSICICARRRKWTVLRWSRTTRAVDRPIGAWINDRSRGRLFPKKRDSRRFRKKPLEVGSS